MVSITHSSLKVASLKCILDTAPTVGMVGRLCIPRRWEGMRLPRFSNRSQPLDDLLHQRYDILLKNRVDSNKNMYIEYFVFRWMIRGHHFTCIFQHSNWSPATQPVRNGARTWIWSSQFWVLCSVPQQGEVSWLGMRRRSKGFSCLCVCVSYAGAVNG